ncbi:unnamed protein product [Thelazia callipaeda]|uniref:Chondroitin sulfate proteoglycan 4 n=1 Tax=Thelazia callipaeda TaxID=103827 RepID=A0A0N5D1U5_THECL|nr:unnamed protein product [Thelazia callipaeda]
MPYCYLLPYVFHVHVLLFGYYYQLVSNSQQRFKRHILPTDHITVHSFNSNISIANWVVVHSDTSKVQFREKFLRGEIWSDYSKLEFQPHGQEENFTAQSNILTIFKLSKLMLQTTCEQIQMSLKANRSADGHSYLQYRADQNVKLILSKGVTRVNVINGEWAHIAAATSNLRMQMEYGNMSIQIAPDYRFLRIKSGLYIVNLRTNVSAFKISITDHVMAVNCESELTQIQIYPNSSNIIITTDQYSRMVLDKGSKSVVLGGEKIQSVGNINIVSMQLNILLKSGDISFIQASANHSLITMQESSTNMALKASHHDMDIIGGKTNLHLFTGNISIDITANADLESLPTMLALFSTPDDNFEDIGPIIDSINGFTIPSKIYSNTTLQSPTLVSQTISDKANSSEFEIIKLQNKSSLENTPDVFSTFDFLFEITTSTTIFEYSTLTIPFQKTTLWLSNFTESSTLLHYEKTSQIGDEDIMTSVDQKNATEITAITADEPYLSVQNSMTSITSSPNISSTISFNYSMISTSQIISNVSQPLIVVPSTTLSNIEVTVQSIIPLIPVTTFISTEITRTVITDIPPTFGTEQMSTSTASTTHLISDNSSREEYSAGGTWPMDNDSSTNNTEFISTTSIKAIIPTTLTTLTSQSGSAWTAFSSPPFEFPSSKRPLPTASLRKGCS